MDWRTPKDDAHRMRSVLFVLVGAVLALYGTILVQSAQSGTTLGKPAIWWVVVGMGTGAFLGLLLAELKLPSAGTRRETLVLGGACGPLLGIVYGLFTVDEDAFWTSLALWTALGGASGASLAWVATRLARGRLASRPDDTGPA